jgi:hypothetical protein
MTVAVFRVLKPHHRWKMEEYAALIRTTEEDERVVVLSRGRRMTGRMWMSPVILRRKRAGEGPDRPHKFRGIAVIS